MKTKIILSYILCALLSNQALTVNIINKNTTINVGILFQKLNESKPFQSDSVIITFDKSAIDNIYLQPNEILNNVDSFWENNKAFSLTKQWHTNNNVKIPYKSWQSQIKKIARLSSEKAKNQKAYINANYIIEKTNIFKEKAIPHIMSFLPKSTPSVNSNIYLLTGTVPYAFAISNNIVIDVASPNFDKNPEKILNILVHEVYHIGFFKTLIYRTEYEYENEIQDFMINYLFSEGLANYVSYKAQHIFPNSKFDDYIMLDNTKIVKKQIEKINLLFAKSNSKSYSMQNLKTMSWEIGVLKRGYYVVGSYMAKMIDEKYGRDSLISTVKSGPIKFINLYNSLVDADMQIYKFKLPGNISAYQKLRITLLNKDYKAFETIKYLLINNKELIDSKLESKINYYGYQFINIDIKDALELFELNTILFPKSSNAFDSLGEIYLKLGNNKLAIENYEKSILLNPNNKNGKNILNQLKNKKG